MIKVINTKGYMGKTVTRYISLLAWEKNPRTIKGTPSILPFRCGFSFSQGRNPFLTIFPWFCAELFLNIKECGVANGLWWFGDKNVYKFLEFLNIYGFFLDWEKGDFSHNQRDAFLNSLLKQLSQHLLGQSRVDWHKLMSTPVSSLGF